MYKNNFQNQIFFTGPPELEEYTVFFFWSPKREVCFPIGRQREKAIFFDQRKKHPFLWGPKEKYCILLAQGLVGRSKKNLVSKIIFDKFEFLQMSRWLELSFSIFIFIANQVFFYMSSEKLEKRCRSWGQIPKDQLISE